MSTSRSKKATKPYHHGDLRRALLDAALALITEHGPNGFTLRETARRAGVSQAAPYRHFPDKAALLLAVAEEGFRQMTERMHQEVRDAKVPRGAELAALGVGYVLFAVEHPAHFKVMFGPPPLPGGPPPAACATGAENYQLLLDAVASARRAGVVGGASVDEVAQYSWSVVHGLASLLVDGQIPDATDPARRRALTERILMLSFEGMAKR